MVLSTKLTDVRMGQVPRLVTFINIVSPGDFLISTGKRKKNVHLLAKKPGKKKSSRDRSKERERKKIPSSSNVYLGLDTYVYNVCMYRRNKEGREMKAGFSTSYSLTLTFSSQLISFLK